MLISVIRQYIEPKIVGSSLGVHPIVTLAGLYFGLKLFGFLGMFIVPIAVMTLKAFNDEAEYTYIILLNEINSNKNLTEQKNKPDSLAVGFLI